MLETNYICLIKKQLEGQKIKNKDRIINGSFFVDNR